MAQAIVTLKTHYRRRPRLITDSEKRGLSIYVLRANTVTQMENFLVDSVPPQRQAMTPIWYGQAVAGGRASHQVGFEREKTISTSNRKPRRFASASINWRDKRICNRPASVTNRGVMSLSSAMQLSGLLRFRDTLHAHTVARRRRQSVPITATHSLTTQWRLRIPDYRPAKRSPSIPDYADEHQDALELACATKSPVWTSPILPLPH